MAFVNDALLRMTEQLLAMQGRRHFAWVQSKLAIVQRRWYGGQIGAEGGYSDNDKLELPEHYEIVPISTAQVFQSGGQYEMGDIRVGPITPAFNDLSSDPPVTGGFTEAQLHPVATTDDVEVFYSISGKHAGEYQFVALESWDPTAFLLVLRRRVNKPVEP